MPENQVTAKALFDAGAGTFDRARRQLVPRFDQFYRAAIDLIPFAADAPFAVLDLGAGTGLLAAFVAQAFPRAELTLVDVSDEMLAQARARFAGGPTRVRFETTDLATARFTGSYDLAISGLAIHHLGNDEKRRLFGEIYRVLRSGGAFINADQVLAPTPAAQQRDRKAWLRNARECGVSETDLEQAQERMRADRLAPLGDQLRWLEEAGFRDVDCCYKHYMFAVYAGFK